LPVLKVDGAATDSVSVSLPGHQSTVVLFTLSRDAAGTYTVNIDGLSGALVVKALPTPTTTPTPTPTPTLTPTPTPTPTSTPTVTSTPTPMPTVGEAEEGLPWWYIVIIVAGVVAIGAAAWTFWYRRRV
jgi:hypothetical protein